MRYALLHTKWLSSHDDQKHVVMTYGDDVVRHTIWTQRPDTLFKTDAVMDAPALIHLQPSTRRTYVRLILSNHIACFPNDSGAITQLGKSASLRWRILPHPQVDPAQFTIGAEIYLNRSGHHPTIWDLERANCPQAGQIGHYACGWCPFHNQPVLVCGCRNRASD